MSAIVAELASMKSCLRQTLQKSMKRGVVLVLGNESCDLDSACSSIAYALFARQRSEYKDKVVAPVLNVKRQQFLSRTEVVFWLNRVLLNNSECSSGAQYDESCTRLLDTLVFVDDIDFAGIESVDELKVKMVDHNRLTDGQMCLEPFVDEIIDHHEVASGSSHQWPHNVKTEIVHPVGSCASLVTRRFQEEWPSMPPSVALLLYGAITLDTAALLNASKTTPIDRNAVDYLESKFSGVDGWPARAATDAMLSEAKEDVSRLCALGILGKDFKKVPRSRPAVGMSTVPMKLKKFARRLASEPDSFERFCREHSLAALVVLTSPSKTDCDGKTRKLIIYSPDEDVRSRVLQAFGGESEEDLRLKQCCVDDIPSETTKVYSLRCGFVSRKKLLPMLERAFSY